MILVTGGAGFIGSNFVVDWLAESDEPVVNFDKLTYAGNLNNLRSVWQDPRHIFVRGDVCDVKQVALLFSKYKPRAVVHFAAESHVDRSIHGPGEFVATNINGTFSLLSAALKFYDELAGVTRTSFRFLHISTDEVFGSLGPNDEPFSENTPYAPNSPYSASKAAADHLVRAFYHTYGLPTLTTNCSNNYGPNHFPEKLIPLMITNALAGKSLPIYGDGQNVRDWLYVGDHCCAIRHVLRGGAPGETYNIGGRNEKTNLEVVNTICDILNELLPRGDGGSYREQIVFVRDRLGHDRRYAVDARKIERNLGWKPVETFKTGMRKTVKWYLENLEWVRDVQSGNYLKWIEKNYSIAK